MLPKAPAGNHKNIVFEPLALTRAKQKSLFEEYYYPSLLVLFVVVTILSKAVGLRVYDALVAGLWVAAVAYFISQAVRYFKHRSHPEANRGPLAGAEKAKPKAQVRAQPKPTPRGPMPRPQRNAKPYDKPFITPYAKKRLPETPQTDKKPS